MLSPDTAMLEICAPRSWWAAVSACNCFFTPACMAENRTRTWLCSVQCERRIDSETHTHTSTIPHNNVHIFVSHGFTQSRLLVGIDVPAICGALGLFVEARVACLSACCFLGESVRDCCAHFRGRNAVLVDVNAPKGHLEVECSRCVQYLQCGGGGGGIILYAK
jgi:hypothetical protein